MLTLADVKNRKTSFLDAVLSGVFTVPGDGSVDYPPIMQLREGAGLSRLAGGRGGAGSGDSPSPDLRPSGGITTWPPGATPGLSGGGDMSRLLSRWQQPNAEGAPSPSRRNAGWGYVGFAAYELQEGQQLTLPAVSEERCLVLVAGRASISTPSRSLTTSAKG